MPRAAPAKAPQGCSISTRSIRWRANLGGREPSERERSAYDDALDLLRHRTPMLLREPAGWFVLDDPQPDAAVCGNTLMLSRGLLESDHLPAVLAHELGHLTGTDGNPVAHRAHPPTELRVDKLRAMTPGIPYAAPVAAA